MRAKDLEIEVKAKLDVEESTAKACLKLVEIYLNAHSELNLMAHKADNGEMELWYEPIK